MEAKRMPVVAGGDQHAVDIRALRQELADVPVHGAILGAILAVDHLFDRLPPVFPDVADGDKLDVGLTHHPVQVAAAAAADADARHHDAFAGGHRPAAAERRGRNDARDGKDRAGGGASFQELSA